MPAQPAPADGVGDGDVRPLAAQNEATPRAVAHPGAPRRTAAHHTDLEPRQILAARLLVSGMGVSDVAAAVGVKRHAVGRWKRDPVFCEEVRRVAAEMVPLARRQAGFGA